MKLTSIGLLLLVAALASAPSQAELVLIVHSSNSEAHLNLDQAQEIYLGRMTAFPGGAGVTAVDQKDGTRSKTEFLAKVLKKDPGQVKAYWSKMIFSGKGVPPAVIGDDAEVKNWVARHPEGLGYIDRGAVDSSVKVLLSVP